MPDARFASRPFEEQIRFFQRKVSVPTETWLDLRKGDHAHAFVIAGIKRIDALNAVRDRIEAAMKGEVSLEQFQKEFRTLGPNGGLEFVSDKARDRRARLIYETNLRQAYNAGRWEQFNSPDMRTARPYLMYRHNDRGYSRNPRPLHQAWHGTILPIDDPWWQTHAPMNGWGCKCGIRALSARDVGAIDPTMLEEGYQWQAPTDGTYEWTDKTTGEIVDVPKGIDPGFDYNVGEASSSMLVHRSFSERLLSLPQEYRHAALTDAQRRVESIFSEVPTILERMLDPNSRSVAPIGLLHPAADAYMSATGNVLDSLTIALQDEHFIHFVRGDKIDRGQAAPLEWLLKLHLHLANPDEIYFDSGKPSQVSRRTGKSKKIAGAIVYVWRLHSGDIIKAPLRINYKLGVRPFRSHRVLTPVTISQVDATSLSESRFTKIWSR